MVWGGISVLGKTDLIVGKYEIICPADHVLLKCMGISFFILSPLTARQIMLFMRKKVSQRAKIGSRVRDHHLKVQFSECDGTSLIKDGSRYWGLFAHILIQPLG